jgi:energy-converting hydrogenase Eha subunit C
MLQPHPSHLVGAVDPALQNIQVANIMMIRLLPIPHVMVAATTVAAVAAATRADKMVVEVIVTTTVIITAIEIRRSTRTLLANAVRSHITSRANDHQAHENVRRIQYDTERGPPALKQFTPYLRQVVWPRNFKLEKLRKYDGKENLES